MCGFEALTAIAAGRRTLEPSGEEVLRILPAHGSPPYGQLEPHLVAKPSLNTSGMVKIIREDDEPSPSCGGIKLSY
jgi:hypothetical protein